MARKLILALASTAALMCAGAAHAGGVSWSVGINLPGVGTVISNAPIYVPAPVVVYQEPAPVVYQRPVPIYAPAPVVYQQPVPVAYPHPQVAYQPPQLMFYPVPRVFAPVPQQVVHVRPAPQWVQHGHGRWNRDDRRWHHDQRDNTDYRDQRDERGQRDHRDEYGERFSSNR